jgi:hypothetical protein
MSITLTRSATTLTLPDDLLWTDEYGWPAVEQRQQYSVAGALVVEAAAKQAGRTIRLEAGDDYAWMPRSLLDTLLSWAALPGEQMALLLRGVTHTVVFDHAAGAIDAQPAWPVSDPASDDPYVVSLRFLKV